MPEHSHPNPMEADGLITRRAAIGGMMTAVLAPALMAASGQEAHAAPAAPTAPLPPAVRSIPALAAPVTRMLHTATVLPDGRVLVVGGVGAANRALSSVQIYDPQHDAWLDAAPLVRARFQHAAALMADGRVLVSGGLFSSKTPLTSAEVYDPALNLWTPAGAMQVGRYGHAISALPSGQVLVTGGCGSHPLTGVEMFLPSATATRF